MKRKSQSQNCVQRACQRSYSNRVQDMAELWAGGECWAEDKNSHGEKEKHSEMLQLQ